MRRYLRQVVSLLLIVSATILAGRAARSARGEPYDRAFAATAIESNAYFIDRPAPDFVLSDGSGMQHTLAELRGKVVFLNFWASWCEPCREEFPAMVGLTEAFEGRPFQMVTVSVDETVDDMQSWLRANGIDTSRMLLLHDPNQTVVRAWGTQLLPETWLIDANGQLVLRFQSTRDWNNPEIRSMIERLIIGRWKQG